MLNFTFPRWLRALTTALLLLCALPAALAAITVTAVTVNGGPTTNVQPGANITVNVTVTLTGGSRWRATSFVTSPTSDLSWCYFSPNISGNGTYTRSFVVPAPSTAGTFTLNTRGYTGSQCSGTVSTIKSLPNAIVTGTPPAALNHVRIIHDGSAQTCGAEPVSLKACANSTCTTLYTGNVVLSLGTAPGTWSSNPVTITNGNATVNLSNATTGTYTLSGTITSPTATTTTAACYRGSTAGDCAMVFTNTSCNFDAVEPAAAPTTPLLTRRIGGPSLTLDVLSLINGTINPSSTASITATLVVGTATGCTTTALSAPVSFTLTGANNGRRSVTFVPTAAARNVRVRMVSGSTVGCSSDNFSIRPAGLTLAATGVSADAAGASTTATPVLKAASTTFSLTATASAGYDGVPVINQNMVQSSSATAGVVGGAFTAAPSATGVAQGSAFTYSEVGYFRFGPYAVYDDDFADVDSSKSPADCLVDSNLGTGTAPSDPNLLVGGKIGCFFGAPASSYFGRFIPASFTLTDGAIANRSAIPGCQVAPEATFSYLGEVFTPEFTLTAVNGAGDTTQNYEGSFARINLATSLGLGVIDAPATAVRTPFPVCGSTPAHPCVTPGAVAGTFAEGEADVTVPLTVFRGITAVGPYADFKVGVMPVDLDNVKLGAYDIDTVNVTAAAPNHTLVASSILRYGRMGIDSAHGSELLNLPMKLTAQYWNGAAYVPNTLDSCTAPAFSTFTSADYLGGLGAANMPFSKLNAGPVLANGIGRLLLTKPGAPAPTVKGSVTVRSSLPYLPGSGRATFGVYKSGPVIYVRETY
jgi:MSHA biogenesis protein MshQ